MEGKKIVFELIPADTEFLPADTVSRQNRSKEN